MKEHLSYTICSQAAHALPSLSVSFSLPLSITQITEVFVWIVIPLPSYQSLNTTIPQESSLHMFILNRSHNLHTAIQNHQSKQRRQFILTKEPEISAE